MRASVIGAVVIAGAVFAAGSAEGASYRPCGAISFTPGTTFASSHYGAKNLRASGTTCAIAQKVAAKAEGKGSHSYASRGFTCKARGKGASGRPWTCKSGAMRVTFVTVGNG